MNRRVLMEDLIGLLKNEFKGYMLLNSAEEMQEIHVYAQYIPQQEGITFGGKPSVRDYTEGDYSTNFPSIVVRMGEMSDTEERGILLNSAKVNILCGVVDKSPECEGWKALLDIQDKIRTLLFEHRVLGRKHVLKMPCSSRLIPVETWPVYFGEMDLVYEGGRAVMNSEYVYRPPLNPPRM